MSSYHGNQKIKLKLIKRLCYTGPAGDKEQPGASAADIVSGQSCFRRHLAVRTSEAAVDLHHEAGLPRSFQKLGLPRAWTTKAFVVLVHATVQSM
jgi:hypothetical protein